VVLGPEWPERALVCAQLIEEGLEVVGIDEWPLPRLYRARETKPRLLIVSFLGLPEPHAVLDEIRFAIDPARVIVIAALGTIPADEVKRFGYRVLTRPVSVGRIVQAATDALRQRESGNES